jgi:hypothetical protein
MFVRGKSTRPTDYFLSKAVTKASLGSYGE